MLPVFVGGYTTLKEDPKAHSSHPSLLPDSHPSITSLSPPPQEGEDLYTWMAKHQDFEQPPVDKVEPATVTEGTFWVSEHLLNII